jgi:putative drug exporter of the RND superfamily
MISISGAESVATSSKPNRPNRLGRIGAWCYDHRRRVVIGWLIGVIAVVVLSSAVGSRFENDFGGVGQSQQVARYLQDYLPAQAGDEAEIVFRSSSSLTSPAVRRRVDNVLSAIRPLRAVTSVSPLVRSANGEIGFASIQFAAVSAKLPAVDVDRVIDKAQSFVSPGLEIALGGSPISSVVSPSPGPSEGIGVTAAIVIMLLAFGSVVAMGLPIITALLGVLTGFGIVALVSRVLIDPSFGPELMAMIGLGVGIDYALFIVTRFRQGLGENRSPREAVIEAMSTSGRAVLFAGSTVLVSLLGLLLIGQEYLDGLAVGTMLAVLAVMAGALTLLPAMLGFAGKAVDRLHVPGLLHRTNPGVERGFWWRWSRTVQRRPALCGAVALVVLVVLALPLFSMRLAFTDSGNDPTTLTTRQAYDLISAGFGPGFNGPLVLAAELPGGAKEHVFLDEFDHKLSAVSGVARVASPIYSPSCTRPQRRRRLRQPPSSPRCVRR